MTELGITLKSIWFHPRYYLSKKKKKFKTVNTFLWQICFHVPLLWFSEELFPDFIQSWEGCQSCCPVSHSGLKHRLGNQNITCYQKQGLFQWWGHNVSQARLFQALILFMMLSLCSSFYLMQTTFTFSNSIQHKVNKSSIIPKGIVGTRVKM